MDEESLQPARVLSSMPGHLISKTGDGKLTEGTEEIDQLDEYHVDIPFWKIVQKLILAPFYLTWVLLVAIIVPENAQYFIFSSFISMLLDPLFLYIPLINEETKCLMLDKKLMIAALILRVITDLRYVGKIGCKITEWRQGTGRKIGIEIRQRICQKIICQKIGIDIRQGTSQKIGIISNVIAILPVPQVAILVFLPRIRGSGSLTIMKFLNSLIFLQYLQRVYPIYRYCKNLNKQMHDQSSPTKPWIPSLINLLIYLLASYVLGSFWYFFSIQREVDCWESACQNEKGCDFSIHCDADTFRNITLLHTSCPINPPDATIFDFGIFLYVLQSGMKQSTYLPQKILLCFSWGLRNLSSFASNLNTSTYGWETLFVVAISISGLIFFIYFLGHVQTFMQIAGKSLESERSRQKMKMTLAPRVRSMLLEYGGSGSPDDVKVLKDSINFVVEKKHLEDPDLVLENMFSIFYFKHEVDNDVEGELNKIRQTLFLDRLNRLDHFGLHWNDMVLKELCKHLYPVIYPKGSYIIREGEPLEMMFFITQGIALTYTSDQSLGGNGYSTTMHLKKGECYGEKLLISWASTVSTSLSNLPNAPSTVKAHKKVEIFALQAADLQSILSQTSSRSGQGRIEHVRRWDSSPS